MMIVPFKQHVLAASVGLSAPFLTLAIPHYKHRQYLEQVLLGVFEQNWADFEILVSDDCSPDDSSRVIPDLLWQSGRSFRYYLQPSNLGYDGNVRFCLASALGRYVFLLGNDDALAGPDTLQAVADGLRRLEMPAVAFTNYADWESGAVTPRAQSTHLLGQGPDTALRFFRSFSFVSGLVFDRAAAQAHATDRWDRSIYYQIYLASRIVAAGGQLGALDVCAVRKDVKLDGQTVPNYVTQWQSAGRSFEPRHTGLDSVIRVAADAILPLLPEREQPAGLRRIVAQILTITYPFWLFEYRRVANWSFSVGVARSLWPRRLLAEHHLTIPGRAWLWLLYTLATLGGLFFPARLFNRFRAGLANLVRRRQQTLAGAEGG